jgi:hypothetical protein
MEEPEPPAEYDLAATLAAEMMDMTVTILAYIGAGVAAGAVLLAVGFGIMKGIGVLSQMKAGV